jgi:tetratricopeptide (TPR) repeat protein
VRDAEDDMIVASRPLSMRALVWLVAAALAAFVLARWLEPRPVPEPPIRQSGAGAPSYAPALAQMDRKLAGLKPLAAGHPDDWLMQERIAHLLMQRARLTGSFRDYADAQATLDRGFASATPGAGPHLTQAALALSLHRLGLAERMLDAVDRYAVPSEAEVRAGVAAMRGDIALYRGHYAAAQQAYLGLSRIGERPDQRLAIFWSKTGRPDDALAAIRRVERSGLVPGEALAQLALLRGTIELQRGDWDEADSAFADAARRFPGWWLVDAYQAQMLALRGRLPEATRAFEALAGRNDDPALRDAIAGLYRARGDYARTELWSGRAARGWDARLRLLPEAALGHAVEHELAFGTPARALELARQDFANRPHGATAIALGWALIANNRPADALRVIDAVNRSSWQSAEQHLVAARAHGLLGQSDAADAEQDKALAINPHALDPNATLLWYGH